MTNEQIHSPEQTQKVIDTLTAIVKEAGKILVERRMDFSVTSKSDTEIVTPADLEANKLIVEQLKQSFNDYGLSSEEEGEEGDQEAKRFIIDPLDGTTKKVWGMSGYTISIAEEIEGQVRSGVVYDPEHDEIFTAVKGQGTYRNGTKIEVSDLTDLSQAFVTCDWGNSDDKRPEGLEYYGKLMLPKMAAKRIVPQFAPANDLCRIAEGRIHALVCNDTWVEDHSAGALLVQEAGGYVTNFYQRDGFNNRNPGIIAASNKELWQQLVNIIFSS